MSTDIDLYVEKKSEFWEIWEIWEICRSQIYTMKRQKTLKQTILLVKLFIESEYIDRYWFINEKKVGILGNMGNISVILGNMGNMGNTGVMVTMVIMVNVVNILGNMGTMKNMGSECRRPVHLIKTHIILSRRGLIAAPKVLIDRIFTHICSSNRLF